MKFDIVARNLHFNEIRHEVYTFEQIWEGRELSSLLKSNNCELLAKRRFIGRTDDLGVDIYEGDIMQDGAVVEWFDELVWDSGGSAHPGFYCSKWFEYEDPGSMSYHHGFDTCKVIGNKWDNPGLVK